MCVSVCVLRDCADSVGKDEGDPRLLLQPVSPPTIDPSCPTQIRLKDTQIHGLLDILNMARCKFVTPHTRIID